jgi:uncharacterized membrane protein YbhN (UPF0104 family)
VLRFFRTILGLLLIAALFWYVWEHPRELERLTQLSFSLLATVFGLLLAAYFCFIVSTWWLIRLDAPGIGLGEYFLVSASGLALNALAPPGSGYAVKTIYLNRRFGLKHRDFLSVNVVVGLLALSASGLLACIALGLIQTGRSDSGPLLWGLAIAALGGSLAMLALIDKALLIPFVRKRNIDSAHFHGLLRHKRRLATTAVLQLLRGGLSFLSFGLLFQAVSGEPILVGGVLDALSVLLRLVHLIPGNVGLYEWVVACLADALGSSLPAGLLTAALFRFIGLASVLLPALFGQFLLRNYSETVEDDNRQSP